MTRSLLVVYVDDMLLCSEDDIEMMKIIDSLESELKKKNLGEPKFCLGMKIIRRPEQWIIYSDQEKYCTEILKRFEINTRPDIAMAVGIVIQFMAKHNRSHRNAVKRIFRYLRGTTELKLKLGRVQQYESKPLISYSDANLGGLEKDQRSTIGHCSFLFGGCISRGSKKQNAVTLSTMEAEYMSLALLTTEVTWLRSLLHELDIGLNGRTEIR
ncbi:uncharacterized protein LOC141857494 [Brevipalpus obovatus]|uniref:uncharacterized protein LOC141857494 n=1 Tax=Brevipalpus obovatus TaxID=246614 RepID=UPI003D9E4EB5